MKKNIYIIATWGKFAGWEPVRYRLEDHALEARTTLPLLMRKASEQLSGILIIGSDSMPQTPQKARNYRDLLKDAHSAYKSWIHQQSQEWDENLERRLRESLSIAVLPQRGGFRISQTGFLSEEGSLEDFRFLLLWTVISWACAREAPELQPFHQGAWKPVRWEAPAEVWVDITHGINWMPTLTLRAVENILSWVAPMLSVRKNGQVEPPHLRVFQCDPVVGAGNDLKGRDFWIHELWKAVPGSPSVPSWHRICFKSHTASTDDLKRINSELEEKAKEITAPYFKNFKQLRAFLVAVADVLPLAAGAFYIRPPVLEDLVGLLVDYWLTTVEVATSGNAVTVRRPFTFSPGAELLPYAYLVADYLTTAGWELKKAIRKEDLATKDTRESLVRFLGGGDDLRREFCRRELSLWKKEWATRAQNAKTSQGNVDVRNLLAHAGLEYNALDPNAINRGELSYSENAREEILCLLADLARP